MVQSYHSTALPTLPAMIARVREGVSIEAGAARSFRTVVLDMRTPRIGRCESGCARGGPEGAEG